MSLVGNLKFNVDFDDIENSIRKIPKDILDKIYVNYVIYKKLVSFDGILSSINENISMKIIISRFRHKEL